jgi:methionyl-tRNA formyltransferase
MLAIASQRRWNADLAHRLESRTGHRFVSIGTKAELTAESLARLGVTRVFLPHWSHLIPADVFDQFECIIFHMTDLPFGRGGSPLQNLIVRGHSDTMITALRCTQELDAGPVYLKHPLSLHGSAEEIFRRADCTIEEMIVTIIETNPVPAPQVGEVVTFARRRPDDGNWGECHSLDQVYDMIRMLDADGYPNAFIDVGEFRVLFSRAARTADGVTADVRIIARPFPSA